MKRIILINGAIAGAIVSGIMLISHPFVEDGAIGFDNGMLVGYASMVLGLSLTFVGIKTYRDQSLGGIITFGQAIKVGLLITLVASLIYAVTWDIYYRTGASDFTEKYTMHYLQKMEDEGASAEEIGSMKKEMEGFNQLYENTFVRFGVTLLEILPVGIVITLLSAAILRRREIFPATR